MRKALSIAALTAAMLSFGGAAIAGDGSSGKNFAFFISHQQNEFMVGLAQAVIDAGKTYGVNIKVYTGDSDPAKQNSQVDNAIAQGVDGIMLDPASYDGLSAAVQAAVNADIPIITVHESVSNQELAASYVGVDLRLGGERQMEQVVKDLGGEGNIAWMYGAMGHPAQIAITNGGKKVLEQYPDVKVVLEGTGNWVAPDALSLAENWLSTGKQIDAIVCNNDGMALGVVPALQSANKVGEVKLYGLDAPPESMRAIKAGTETASIYNDAKTEGMKAVETMIAVSEGKPVEKEIIIAPIVVTKDNVDQYLN